MGKTIHNIYFLIFRLKIVSFRYLFLNVLATILSSLNITVNLVFFKIILDDIVLQKKIVRTLFYIVVYVIYLLVDSLIKIWLGDVYNPKYNVLIQQKLQKIMFDKIKTLDISCYENSDFYNKYVRAMNEIESRFFKIMDTILQFVSGIISVFSISILITTLNPIFIIFAVFMVINTMIRGYKSNQYKYLLDKENTKNQRYRNYVKRVFYLEQYIKEFKLFPLYSLFIRIYDKATEKIIENVMKYNRKIGWIDLYSMLFSILTTSIMLYILCNKVIEGKLTASDFMILFTSVNNLSTNLSGILNVFPSFAIHSMYIDNLLEVLNYKPKVKVNNSGICIDNSDFKKICFKNVSFKYEENNSNVLSDISLSIESGKKVAIVGRNGSGKSTFIKLLLRLYDPQYGIIEMNGNRYPDLDINSLRGKFSVMFQDYNIYALTIGEIILMESVTSKKQETLVWDALKFSGLYDKVSKLNNGIHTAVTREFDNDGVYLSGGEKQLLSIARAYASKGSILVFDEPSSSLDIFFEQQLFSKLRAMGENKTVIFITHKLYSTVDADIIYFFEDGRIIEAGTHNELIKLKGKYKKMYDTQLMQYGLDVAYNCETYE